MAETPYYSRSDYFDELEKRLEAEKLARESADTGPAIPAKDTGESKRRPIDPAIQEALDAAMSGRQEGQGLALVKTVLDYVRDGGNPEHVRGLITRRDLINLGVIPDPVKKRKEDREERRRNIDAKTAEAQQRFQEQRKKLFSIQTFY